LLESVPVTRALKIAVLTAAYLPLQLALPLGGAASRRDLQRQLQPKHSEPLPESWSQEETLSVLRHAPFRTIFYHRLKLAGPAQRLIAAVLSVFYKREPAMFISCDDIGPGLMLMHGFATIITAQRIGTDCQVAQQVTIGYDDRGAPPIFGDRVRVGSNAVVIGPVTLGDDAVVGAGAVVVRDVPPGVVVGGVPAKILEGATDRFSALKRGAE
jgi:serine acetyltransferase